ncbi:hypothetical protein [Mycolicibacterium sphagni]|uniref:hypothetical protein n=1 Tax=Mycolicibacterium sphagni TaxID=1786 RepID=UPI0021F31082|nr:hypothetical protein [Mycolicibacterium sphagni]MCV7174880.1 hypothetical protein [Mycolicibacterium sphagni]
MIVEVFDNQVADPSCPGPGLYWLVRWSDDDGQWQAKVFPTSDPRLQRYLAAVEQLKLGGVGVPDDNE